MTCPPGQYGVNCNRSCWCHHKNCDPVSGACYLRKTTFRLFLGQTLVFLFPSCWKRLFFSFCFWRKKKWIKVFMWNDGHSGAALIMQQWAAHTEWQQVCPFSGKEGNSIVFPGWGWCLFYGCVCWLGSRSVIAKQEKGRKTMGRKKWCRSSKRRRKPENKRSRMYLKLFLNPRFHLEFSGTKGAAGHLFEPPVWVQSIFKDFSSPKNTQNQNTRWPSLNIIRQKFIAAPKRSPGQSSVSWYCLNDETSFFKSNYKDPTEWSQRTTSATFRTMQDFSVGKASVNSKLSVFGSQWNRRCCLRLKCPLWLKQFLVFKKTLMQ